MVAIQLKRWTRQEYDRMIEAGVFSPGDRIQLIDGGYATQNIVRAGESIQPPGRPTATIEAGELLP